MQELGGLCDKRAYLAVLGSLMQDPMRCDDTDRPLSKEDFSTEKFYQIIYISIFNLYQQGVERIDEYAIDSYLSNYNEQYKIFQENNGIIWVADAIQMAQLENYEYYYHRVRKFSLLRYYEGQGLDTSCLFDWKKFDTAEEQKKFDDITEEEIVDFIENKYVVEPKNNFCKAYSVVSAQAGKGMSEMIDELMEVPDYGYSLASLAFNTAARGGRLGKLYFISGGTGSGKSRNFLMNACAVSIPYKYDNENKQFIYTGQDTPTLYIGSEGSIPEFQSIVLACVSGVAEDKILMGMYEEDELERVRQAEEYISASPLYLVYCDEFTIADIENLIKSYVLQKGIRIAIFDYIQTTAKMMGDLTSRARIKLQEYQVLVQFAGRLKALAEKLDILVLSGSQLRPDAKELRYKDETALAGCKGMAQKCDVGTIISRPTPAEKKKIEKITDHMLGVPEVNMLMWVYKVRRGRLVSIIILQHIDLGTMRVKDICVTDFDFNLIDIDFTKIEQMDKVVEEKSRKLDLSKMTDENPSSEENDNEKDDIKEINNKPVKIIF